MDKADSINKSDPVGAKLLAVEACNNSCGYVGTVSLMRCHNYGLLLDRRTYTPKP